MWLSSVPSTSEDVLNVATATDSTPKARQSEDQQGQRQVKMRPRPARFIEHHPVSSPRYRPGSRNASGLQGAFRRTPRRMIRRTPRRMIRRDAPATGPADRSPPPRLRGKFRHAPAPFRRASAPGGSCPSVAPGARRVASL